MSNRKKSSATAEGDEVEQLLQAAQDDVLLKLSVDSHMSRVAPDYLDPDLHRRFQVLRSRPSTSQSKSQQQKQSSAPLKQQQQKEEIEEEKKERNSKVAVVDNVDEELRGVLGDDLSARFAALKASLSSSSPTPATTTTNEVLEKSNGDAEEDEVEKVIQWAMDAARLNPSPPSDDDDDHIDSDEDDNDDYDDDDDYDPKNKRKESKRKK